MCGRFYVEDDEALEERILRLNRSTALRTGDIHPGEPAGAFLKQPELTVQTLAWGFDMKDGKLLINARSETAAVKSMFRELWRSCRLLLPAHGYYEWDSAGKKHVLGMGERMYLAGLYRPDRKTFVILTREAAPGIRSIHDRMPVIFTGRAASDWLRPEYDPSRVLAACETDSVKAQTLQLRFEV